MRANSWSLFRLIARRQQSADADPLPDAELLRRFAASRDPAAFELLVWRHGAMVLGTCKRILRDEHAAEDAFQATFLVLARKAGSMRTGGSAAGWLHRVARRIAVRAAKRVRHVERLADDPSGRPPNDDGELRAVLDAEIDRLPDRFRMPVVLCYLDGRTTEDAAALLGVPRGTVLSRLATARQKLADRLTRRGIMVPAGLLAVGLTTETLSAELVGSSLRAAVPFAAGLGGALPATELAERVLRMGTRIKLGAWAAALVAVAGLGTGYGVVAGTASPEPAQAKAATKPAAPPKPAGDDQDLIKQARDRERVERELRDLERTERMKKLGVETDRLDTEVMRRLDQVRVFKREAAENVDAKTLEAAVTKTDERILSLEDEIATSREDGEGLRKLLANIPAMKRSPQALEAFIRGRPEFMALLQDYQNAKERLERLKTVSKPDSERLARAEAEVKAMSEQYDKAHAAVLATAEKDVRDAEESVTRERIKEHEMKGESLEKQLKVTVHKRAQLAERLARAKQSADRVQLVEDELKVFREVRQEVLRQKLRLEIGLDEPAKR